MSYLDQILGTGDGETTEFALRKRYLSGEQSYTRPILKPVDGSVRAGVNGDPLQEGVHYQVDTGRGIIMFVDAPDPDTEVTAGFEFDAPGRSDTDIIQTSVASFYAGDVPSVPIIEVRA